MTALTTDILETLRRRRKQGAKLPVLARDLGITWQKLDKALRHGLRGVIRIKTTRKTTGPVVLVPEATGKVSSPAGTGPLTERYRPRSLDGLWGQPDVVIFLRAFLQDPYPAVFLFDGETGTGKTSAAVALAGELGCDLEAKPREFGGIHEIASGEQTAETVREIYNAMWRCPLAGSGWKVLIVNEADRISPAAETIWLDRLEQLPPRTVMVFTTNHPERLSARFRDRATPAHFVSDGPELAEAVRSVLKAIWRQETGRAMKPDLAAGLVDGSTDDGQLSFRRAIQAMTPLVLAEKAKRERR